jgi:sulfite exporter TauE/SafE/copper chaperone CopZ
MSKRKNQNSCTYYVDGMHCASCEVLIEKKLLKHNGVKRVDATLKNSKVEFTFDDKNPVSVDDLNNEFEDMGYTFSSKKKPHKKETPLIKMNNGNFEFNSQKWKGIIKVGSITFSFLIAFYLFEKLQLGGLVNVDANSSLPAFFLLGLVAGLSSCAALIGGLLLSMVKQWNELYIDSDSQIQKAQPHILFHVGRLASFFIFGGILGLIGERITLNNTLFYSFMVFAISAVMLILALQMLDVSWAQKIRLTAPKSFGRFASDETRFKGRFMPFIIGSMTFILPCGFTLIAQGIALTSGSFITGAMIMLMFALGTLPILLGISFSGVQLNKKPHLTARFNQVAGILIIFFVIYNVNAQLNVLGLPSLSDISVGGDEQNAESSAEASQELTFIASGFNYTPTGGTVLKAGVPSRLVVDNQGIQGCGSYMAARGLIEGFISLKSGENIIDLGSPEAGTYKLTCSMGMVPPVTITVQ